MVGGALAWKCRHPRSERGLETGQRVRHRVALGGFERPVERGSRRRHDPVVEAAQLVEAFGERRRDRIRRELGERRVERDQELERGRGLATGVEIQPGTEGELLARQGGVAPGQESREARLGGRDPPAASDPARALIDELARVRPEAVGHLLAGAVADANHERVVPGDAVGVWIGHGETIGVERPVEDGEILVQRGVVGGPQPRGGLVGPLEGAPDVDHGGASRYDGGRLRLRLSLTLTPRRDQPAPFVGSEGGQHEHVRGRCVRSVALAPDEIAAVGWAERPGQLDLGEAKEGDGPEAI
jgi:hypothetical protein